MAGGYSTGDHIGTRGWYVIVGDGRVVVPFFDEATARKVHDELAQEGVPVGDVVESPDGRGFDIPILED